MDLSGFITVKGREIITDIDVVFLTPQYSSINPIIYYDKSVRDFFFGTKAEQMIDRLKKRNESRTSHTRQS